MSQCRTTSDRVAGGVGWGSSTPVGEIGSGFVACAVDLDPGASGSIDNVTPQDSTSQLLTIGEFGRRARLTTKALRIYDDLGLLRPATTESSNNYRYYDIDQLDTARLIGLLRGTDMSLHDIGRLLDAATTDRRAAIGVLDQHLEELESHHSARRLLVRHIHSILRKEHHIMFETRTRYVDTQRVMSIQRRLHGSETDAFVREAKAAFAAHLDGVEPIGPFILVFHGLVDDDNDGPIEAMLGCPDSIQPTELIGIRTEPAHDEAFTTITKAQWDFPAILAAYDAVACSPEVTARPGSTLSCREVYLAEPDAIGDDDLICDIAFPLA